MNVDTPGATTQLQVAALLHWNRYVVLVERDVIQTDVAELPLYIQGGLFGAGITCHAGSETGEIANGLAQSRFGSQIAQRIVVDTGR